jgi:hypothetical protein
MGSIHPILTLPFSRYIKWVDMNWITSTWYLTSMLAVTIEVESQWVPKLARQGDAMIMDIVLQYNFSPAQQRQINHCRLYLQILLLSDITSANGGLLLPEISLGQCLPARHSDLQWPDFQRPPDWSAWHMLLQYISHSNRLLHPLGDWLLTPHQKWEWFHDSETNAGFFLSADGTTKTMYTMMPNTARYPMRRGQQALYGEPMLCDHIPSLDNLRPPTIQFHNSAISSPPSTTSFPIPHS